MSLNGKLAIALVVLLVIYLSLLVIIYRTTVRDEKLLLKETVENTLSRHERAINASTVQDLLQNEKHEKTIAFQKRIDEARNKLEHLRMKLDQWDNETNENENSARTLVYRWNIAKNDKENDNYRDTIGSKLQHFAIVTLEHTKRAQTVHDALKQAQTTHLKPKIDKLSEHKYGNVSITEVTD